MKKPLPVGLVVEGNATESAVLRLPGIGEHIGPVMSTNLRVARRFTNAFRAGFAVETCDHLGETRLILLRVPDSSLERLANVFIESELDLSNKCFAVCETWLCSESLSLLRSKGAAVASLSLLPGPGTRWFIAEGDKPALRHLGRLIEWAGGRMITLRKGTKPLYYAAEHLTTILPLSMYSAAQIALREAGISGKILTAVLERLNQRLVKNFRAGNRLMHLGPFHEAEGGYGEAEWNLLRARTPDIAQMISMSLEEYSAFRVSRQRRGRNTL